MLYLLEQCLNGIQLGMLLFLLAAGLTLIFGIMDLVNLAHGSLYMLGAYFAATFAAVTGSFVLGAILALLATLVVALLLYVLVMRTRVGMLIRAGASNREMVGALGVNIKLLYTLVFGLGAALAGFAGLMQAPILTVQIGMGENILILAFVVIIIGGIGSIRGAFVASVIVGLIDTIGRAFIPDIMRYFVSYSAGSSAGPALSSMIIYMLMALVLIVRPEGLFPAASK